MISYEDLQKIKEQYPQIEIIVTESGYQLACPAEVFDQVLSAVDSLEVKYYVYELVKETQ